MRAELSFGLGFVVALSAYAAEWPEFRGPNGDGHAAVTVESEQLPVRWSETENVVWKTAIPNEGWSTPVVADGEMWLTSATEDGTDYYLIGLSTEDGAIFYNERLFHSDAPEPLGNNVNRYASPSCAIQDGRLYVHFGSYGTACLDTKTREIVWQRKDLECRHYRGPGSSVYLFEDLVILTFDGVDQQYLTALKQSTGETVWRTDRTTKWTDWDENGLPLRDGDARKAFSTPVLSSVGGFEQLISPGASACYAYDPRTGRELWNVTNASHTPSTRPVFYDDLVIMATGYGQTELRAIRLGGHGDVTESHVVWSVTGGHVPDTPSPIVVGDYVYTISNKGMISCFDAASGEMEYSEKLGGNFVASPIYAGGRLYIANVQGDTTVVKPGPVYEVLATNELDEGLMASPVAVGKALYLRTKTDVYRIEE